MPQKRMQVMMERDHDKPLSGFIELDDAYLGGQRSGCKPGRGAAGNTPIIRFGQNIRKVTSRSSPIVVIVTLIWPL